MHRLMKKHIKKAANYSTKKLKNKSKYLPNKVKYKVQNAT